MEKPSSLDDYIYRVYLEYSSEQLSLENEKLLEQLFELKEVLRQIKELEIDAALISQKLRIIDEVKNTKIQPWSNSSIPPTSNHTHPDDRNDIIFKKKRGPRRAYKKKGEN